MKINVQCAVGLLEGAKQIREEVFVKEQGFQEEFDTIDEKATHIVLSDGMIPVACCRYFLSEYKNTYYIGRVAVRKKYRKEHLGAVIMKQAEEEIRGIGGKRIILHAQCSAQKFYEKQGYVPFGEIGEEEGCPHIWMEKILD